MSIFLLFLLLTVYEKVSCQSLYMDAFANANSAAKPKISPDVLWSVIQSVHEYIQDSANFVGKSDLLQEVNGANSSCLNYLGKIPYALYNKTQWALQMLDATGKPSAGISSGALHWTGSYETCLNISTPNTTDPPNLQGRYCMVNIMLNSPNPASMNFDGSPISMNLGVCVPDVCSTEDIVTLTNTVLWYLPLGNVSLIATNQSHCHQPPDTLPRDGWFVFAVVLACTLLFLVGASSILELVLIAHRWMQQEYEAQKQTRFSNDVDDFSAPHHHRHRVGQLAVNAASPFSNGRISELDEASNDEEDNEADHEQLVRPAPATSPSKLSSILQSKSGYPKELNRTWRILISFSLITHVPKLMDTSVKPEYAHLTSLDGLRFISMSWVILGHTYVFALSIVDNLLPFAMKNLKLWPFLAITSATVSVDTFFFLSGFLTMYFALPELERTIGLRKNLKFWGLYVFHRFWRLTPAYLVVLLLYTGLFPYVNDSPFWPQVNGIDGSVCKDHFWITYLNNLVYKDQICMGWTWYLANDMQFYLVLGPILLLFATRGPVYRDILFGISVFVLVIVCSVLGVQISLDNTIGIGVAGLAGNNGFVKLYIVPYTRWSPYVVGMATGYLLQGHLLQRHQLIPKSALYRRMLLCAGYSAAAAICLAVIYGPWVPLRDQAPFADSHAYYNGLSRLAWSVGVAIVVFFCATGYGGPINSLLSWAPFRPLSRLTYCAYLVHPVIMVGYALSQYQPFLMNNILIAGLFCSYLMLAYGAAFIVSMAIEAPLRSLERELFGNQH